MSFRSKLFPLSESCMHTNAWHSSLVLPWTKKLFLMKTIFWQQGQNAGEELWFILSLIIDFQFASSPKLPKVTSTASKEVTKPLGTPAQEVVFSMNSCRHGWIFLNSADFCIYSIFPVNLRLTALQFQRRQGKANQTNKCVSAQWRKGKAPSFHVAGFEITGISLASSKT